MPTIAPQAESERWLRATLVAVQADALSNKVGTRVYRSVAPAGAAAPFTVYQFVAGRPIRVQNNIVWYQEDFQVMTVTRDSTLSIEDVEEAVMTRLERAQGETTDAVIIDCRRLNDYEVTTIEEGGERWERLGGLWRILAKPKTA